MANDTFRGIAGKVLLQPDSRKRSSAEEILMYIDGVRQRRVRRSNG